MRKFKQHTNSRRAGQRPNLNEDHSFWAKGASIRTTIPNSKTLYPKLNTPSSMAKELKQLKQVSRRVHAVPPIKRLPNHARQKPSRTQLFQKKKRIQTARDIPKAKNFPSFQANKEYFQPQESTHKKGSTSFALRDEGASISPVTQRSPKVRLNAHQVKGLQRARDIPKRKKSGHPTVKPLVKGHQTSKRSLSPDSLSLAQRLEGLKTVSHGSGVSSQNMLPSAHRVSPMKTTGRSLSPSVKKVLKDQTQAVHDQTRRLQKDIQNIVSQATIGPILSHPKKATPIPPNRRPPTHRRHRRVISRESSPASLPVSKQSWAYTPKPIKRDPRLKKLNRKRVSRRLIFGSPSPSGHISLPTPHQTSSLKTAYTWTKWVLKKALGVMIGLGIALFLGVGALGAFALGTLGVLGISLWDSLAHRQQSRLQSAVQFTPVQKSDPIYQLGRSSQKSTATYLYSYLYPKTYTSQGYCKWSQGYLDQQNQSSPKRSLKK